MTLTGNWVKHIEPRQLKKSNISLEFDKTDGVTPDEIREGKIRPGYEHVNVHIIFDINMDGKFTRKEKLVDEGHITD